MPTDDSILMKVMKRDGNYEDVAFEKVQERIRKAGDGLAVNATLVAQQVLTRIVNGIKTTELDDIAARLSESLCTTHIDYGTLAARLAISNHQKQTPKTFVEAMNTVAAIKDRSGCDASLLDETFLKIVNDNAELIESKIDYSRDYLFDYFGFKTLERAYLLQDKIKGYVIERPQHLWMRVAIGLWYSTGDFEKAFETYELLSQKKYTHATPTLFNAGTKRPQLSSCFLMGVDDSIRGIYKTLTDCALISQYGGGIGIHVSNIRGAGSLIRGTGGTSSGIMPMLRVFNNTARYVDQCFTDDTLIDTEAGPMPICTLVPGMKVKTSGTNEISDETGKHFVLPTKENIGKLCPIKKIVVHDYNGPLMKIHTGSTAIRVTPKHPILSNKSGTINYIEANNLKEGDQVVSTIGGKICYYTIDKIEDINEYVGKLYDLEIENVHDYSVSNFGIVHNGGGKRNGSFAIYLEPWHSDVEVFLEMKKNTGSEEERARDLFYALWIPDLFMERVDKNGTWSLFCPDEAPGLADVVGKDFNALYEKYEAEGRAKKTVSAQKLWFKILDSQIETGTPYLLYKDAANLKSNQQNLGVIKSSNLCVAPETMILTSEGYVTIESVVNKFVQVWNGNEWSKVEVKQTGKDQKLIKVNFSNGTSIECTEYHKFIISEGYTDKSLIKSAKRIEAKDLKTGMKLIKYENCEPIPGKTEKDFKYAYTHGFFCGDGTYSSKRPYCSLYGDKKELFDYLDIVSSTKIEDKSGRFNVKLPEDLNPKYSVPLGATIENKLRWLEGLLDADGCVARNGKNESLQIGSIEFEFLNNIRLMLDELGINSKVTKCRDECKTLLPDGKGGKKLFDCKKLYRLLISSTALYKLVNMGLNPKRLKIKGAKPQRCAEQFISVIGIEDTGRIDDTYCFNEPDNHAGVFNGILTGNCTEIIEYTAPDEIAVCNLASMNLPSFVTTDGFDFKQFRSVVKTVVRNLNRVIDINYYPIIEGEKSNKRHRPIGLGVQGLSDVFAMLKIPWESVEASDLNKKIFAHMYYASVEASVDLAAKEGPYETFYGSPAHAGKLQFSLWGIEPYVDEDLDWDGLINAVSRIGMRNSLLVAPMPTASTAQILGNTESIEPIQQNIFTRRTLAGEFFMMNKHLMKALLERGLWTTDLKDKIIGNNGSVQGISEVPSDIQALFKTVWELKMKTLIDMAADRAPYICQSQSLNLFIGDATYSKLTSMHFYAWRKGLKTGIYYLRTRAVASAQKFTIDPKMSHVLTSAPKAAGGAGASKEEEKECTMCSS